MRILTPTVLAGMLAAAPLAFAQNYIATPPPAASGQFQSLPPIEQLVAPIALYPDPLIALMLPAAAYPDQIQAIAANPAGADDPSFDPSVQGLAHYPGVVSWMAGNLPWTQQLGGAFAGSPTDVMAAIQNLRQRARAAGTLAPSNHEQVVVDQDGQIEILPAQPDTIEIPSYDPSVVYWTPPSGYSGDYFGWSEPYPIGAWLTYDFDWHRHALWYGDWYGYRRDHGGWNRPIDYAHVNISVAIGHGHAWRPPEHPPSSPVGHHFFGRDEHIAQPRAADAPGFRRAPETGRGPEPRARDPRDEHRPNEAPAPANVRPRPEEQPHARPEEQPRARPEEQPRGRPEAQPAERSREPEPQRNLPERRVEAPPHVEPNTPPPVHPVPTREQPPHPVPVRPPAPPHPVQAPRSAPPPPAPEHAPAPEDHRSPPDRDHDH